MLIHSFQLPPRSFTVPVTEVSAEERCAGFPQGLPLPDPSSLGLEGGAALQLPKFAAQAMVVDAGDGGLEHTGGSRQLPALPSWLIKACYPSYRFQKGRETAPATVQRRG